MERTIKFRGKKGNRWFYGGYHKHIDITPSPTYKDSESYEKDILEHTHHLIVEDGFSDYWMPRGVEAQEVEADTIGQSTGINDRNGVEIYEGDILQLWTDKDKEYARLLSVKYDKLWCAFVVEDEAIKEQYILWTDFLEWEVVGNIYDNPELLKEDINENY